MSFRFVRLTSAVGRLERLIRKNKMDGVRDLGLKGGQTMILYTLYQNVDGLSFMSLCEELGEDAGLVSRTVKVLAEQGLVVRRGSPGRYGGRFVLSEDGRRQAFEISGRIELAEARVRAGISDEELAVFYRVADQLASNMELLDEEWR